MIILLCIATWLNMTVRMFAAALCFTILFSSFSAVAADRTSDEFLTGYVASILERDLNWKRDSYILEIVNGATTITVYKEDPVRQEAAGTQLRAIDGIHEVTIVVKPSNDAEPEAAGSFMAVTGQGKAYPVGDLFQSLIADPKQPQFFVSLRSFSSMDVRYTMASVGFGETFGMYRFYGIREGDGLQLSLEGALFAQFNLDSASSDLINADYTIGIPVTYRYGDNSFRFRLYHQSSHLGDELLLSANHPNRVNLSYESIELIYSREWHAWRVYGGGEYLVHKEPSELKPAIVHWGLEYRGDKPFLWSGRPIVGLDMKCTQENDWYVDTSIKAGLEFGHHSTGQRRLRLMAEWYTGYDPHGQFYNNKVDSIGLGVALGF
ncbi:DUF1207 domain-containing protein [uncultured Desulfobacter sp.]|uniref:DUF1207 domain-containing protein n=1 Tax=uncultured Desulfobacter sp. TaxID=240139 RepID=UPI0029C613BB|nr:DUF1207 domain-containing protein [uncultured Desulfobacter sp.]